ncbi:MAG: TATA-box-binding protein [Candidatus Lokiarchaeota archaeon]
MSPKETNDENEEKLDFKIENVVGTVFVQSEGKLDLVHISRKIPDVEYNPERFPGVIMRIENPRATFLIFTTGKMVLTGLKKASQAKAAVDKAVKKLIKTGIKVWDPEIAIVNIVASGDLGVHVDLNMAALVMEYAMYEPEVFPGLIYRLQDPRAVFLIFSTGKIVCTGIKNENLVADAVKKLKKEIEELDLTVDTEYGGSQEYQDITFL